MSWSVRVDHLTDDQLVFFGWYRVHTGEEFSVYYCPRYGESQVVQNTPPRRIIVDDPNDAQTMCTPGHEAISIPVLR